MDRHCEPSSGENIRYRCRIPPSAKQLDIEADRLHEQVHVRQALSRHIRRQRLRVTDGTHDTILDTKDKTLLLIRGRADADGGEKLPDVDVVARVDAAREDVGQARLDDVKEGVESRLPA